MGKMRACGDAGQSTGSKSKEVLCPLPWGGAESPSNNVAWAEV